MNEQNSFDLRWISAVLRRLWWLIVGITLLAAALAWLVSKLMTPTYEASVKLLASPAKASKSSQYTDLIDSRQLALTYSQMIKDRPVLDAAIAKMGIKMDPENLKQKITTEAISDTQIIQLTVTDSNPKQAALIANTIAQAFTTRVEEISSERFATEIQSAQDQLNELDSQLKENQVQVDKLRSQQAAKQAAISDQQGLLYVLQNDHRSLLDQHQSVQLLVSEATGEVYLVEPVQPGARTPKGSYTSSAVLSLGRPSTESAGVALTYGQLMLKPTLLQTVIDKLGLSVTATQLSNSVSVNLVSGTRLIRLVVENSDQTKAQLIAQTLTEVFTAQLKALFAQPYSDQLESLQNQIDEKAKSIATTQNQITALSSDSVQLSAEIDRINTKIDEQRSDYRTSQQKFEQAKKTAAEAIDSVVIIEPAHTPTQSGNSPIVNAILAAMVGFMIGIGLVFLLEQVNDKVRTEQDVNKALGHKPLGTISKNRQVKNGVGIENDPYSTTAEDFRILCAKILNVSCDERFGSLLVTSPNSSEGKTTLIANMATAFTKLGVRVAVVDADLRFPTMHKVFGLEQVPGLTDYLLDGSAHASLPVNHVNGVTVLTAGSAQSDPVEMINSPKLPVLIKNLSASADIILIDCPPLLSSVDSTLLASIADRALLVLSSDITSNQDAKEAYDSLSHGKARVIGVVLNNTSASRKAYYKPKPAVNSSKNI